MLAAKIEKKSGGKLTPEDHAEIGELRAAAEEVIKDLGLDDEQAANL